MCGSSAMLDWKLQFSKQSWLWSVIHFLVIVPRININWMIAEVRGRCKRKRNEKPNCCRSVIHASDLFVLSCYKRIRRSWTLYSTIRRFEHISLSLCACQAHAECCMRAIVFCNTLRYLYQKSSYCYRKVVFMDNWTIQEANMTNI